MRPEISLVEHTMRGFRKECDLLWVDVARMLDFCAKDCRPNKLLETTFKSVANFCRSLPESVKADHVAFTWSEHAVEKVGPTQDGKTRYRIIDEST